MDKKEWGTGVHFMVVEAAQEELIQCRLSKNSSNAFMIKEKKLQSDFY